MERLVLDGRGGWNQVEEVVFGERFGVFTLVFPGNLFLHFNKPTRHERRAREVPSSGEDDDPGLRWAVSQVGERIQSLRGVQYLISPEKRIRTCGCEIKVSVASGTK